MPQLTRRGYVEVVEIRSAERARGHERARHLDFTVDASVGSIANNARAPVLCAPEKTLPIHRGSVGMGDTFRELSARPDLAPLDIEWICADREVGRICEIHGAVVGTPREAVRVTKSGFSWRERPVGIEAV